MRSIDSLSEKVCDCVCDCVVVYDCVWLCMIVHENEKGGAVRHRVPDRAVKGEARTERPPEEVVPRERLELSETSV